MKNNFAARFLLTTQYYKLNKNHKEIMNAIVIVIFLICVCPIFILAAQRAKLFILAAQRAKLFIDYNNRIDPNRYSNYDHYLEILNSFDSHKVLFKLTNNREFPLEKHNEELEQVGQKLSKVTLYYFLYFFCFVVAMILLVIFF